MWKARAEREYSVEMSSCTFCAKSAASTQEYEAHFWYILSLYRHIGLRY